MERCSLEYAESLVADQFAKAEADLHLRSKGFVFPKVVWKAMGIHKAGYCSYTYNTITLNSNYLTSADWQQFLNETPLHELAHAISWQLYDEHGHKRVWKSVAMQLGLKGDRCHNFATPDNPKGTRVRKTYTAHCPCMTHVITSIKRNRILNGTTNYICVKCHQRLVLD